MKKESYYKVDTWCSWHGRWAGVLRRGRTKFQWTRGRKSTPWVQTNRPSCGQCHKTFLLLLNQGQGKKIWFVRENTYTVGAMLQAGQTQYCRPDKCNTVGRTNCRTKVRLDAVQQAGQTAGQTQNCRPDKRNTVGRTNGRTKVRLGQVRLGQVVCPAYSIAL